MLPLRDHTASKAWRGRKNILLYSSPFGAERLHRALVRAQSQWSLKLLILLTQAAQRDALDHRAATAQNREGAAGGGLVGLQQGVPRLGVVEIERGFSGRHHHCGKTASPPEAAVGDGAEEEAIAACEDLIASLGVRDGTPRRILHGGMLEECNQRRERRGA